LVSPLRHAEFLRIARNGINSVYDPKKFHAIIIRCRIAAAAASSVTGLVFQCGKVILTGAKSHREAKMACMKICKMVNRILAMDIATSSKLMPHSFMLRNAVASSKFPSSINLLALYYHLKGAITYGKWLIKVRYDPSIFSGLRVSTNQFTSTLFASGKFIVTGLKSFSSIDEKFENLSTVVTKFLLNE
jgi:TATA-box binding protein (TBP) (component of TFIID and TFIIIB)